MTASQSILFIDTYYPEVISALGFDDPHDLAGDYAESAQKLVSKGFGTGGAYARAFQNLGWDAHILIPNARGLQISWWRESKSSMVIDGGWRYALHLARLPLVRDHLHRVRHIHHILLEQVKSLKPDVIVVQDLNLVPLKFAQELRKYSKVLIGEIASPLPPKQYFLGYDVIVSALPSIVEQARSWGIESHYIPLGFDERWASASPATQRPIDAIFVGSFSRHQPQTIPLLKAVAQRIPGFQIYGPATKQDIDQAGLTAHYRGQLWGEDMFKTLAQSKIVVNRHGTIAGNYAVNMRMYEATGAGAALVTEQKSNLSDLFEADREVIAYQGVEDAAEKASELLRDPKRLAEVASAGHRRTMTNHTYSQRAHALREIVLSKLG